LEGKKKEKGKGGENIRKRKRPKGRGGLLYSFSKQKGKKKEAFWEKRKRNLLAIVLEGGKEKSPDNLFVNLEGRGKGGHVKEEFSAEG